MFDGVYRYIYDLLINSIQFIYLPQKLQHTSTHKRIYCKVVWGIQKPESFICPHSNPVVLCFQYSSVYLCIYRESCNRCEDRTWHLETTTTTTPPPPAPHPLVFFGLCLNKRLSKQSRRRWFETRPCSLWRHCNDRTTPDTNKTQPCTDLAQIIRMNCTGMCYDKTEIQPRFHYDCCHHSTPSPTPTTTNTTTHHPPPNPQPPTHSTTVIW